MISDYRRSELDSVVREGREAASAYLDKIEATIVQCHKAGWDGFKKAQILAKISNILQGFVEVLADNISNFDDLNDYSDLKKRATDYMRQYNSPPPDIHQSRTFVPGATVYVEEEESHEYEVTDDGFSGTMTAKISKPQDDKLVITGK